MGIENAQESDAVQGETVDAPSLTKAIEPPEPVVVEGSQATVRPATSQTVPTGVKPLYALLRTNSVLYAFAGLSAAIAVGLQITWTRLFSLVFGSSTYAVAAVIACCLIGLAFGSAIATFLLKHKFNRFTILAVTTLLASLLVTGTLFGITRMPLLLAEFQISLAPIVSSLSIILPHAFF